MGIFGASISFEKYGIFLQVVDAHGNVKRLVRDNDGKNTKTTHNDGKNTQTTHYDGKSTKTTH